MKIYRLYILVFAFFIFGCTSKSDRKYIFYSGPAFFSGFTLELDESNSEILVSIPANYFVSDSISKTYFKFLDSIEFKKIKPFVPQDSKLKFNLREDQFENLKANLKSLSEIHLSKKDMIPPTDGITIMLKTKSKNDSIEKVFYSPSKESNQGKIITEIYSQLEQISSKDYLFENAIENSQRYFSDRILKLKSTNPLYVKILTEDCGDLETEINKLPKSEKIYLDITNMRSYRDDCLEKVIRKKYAKICIVGNEAFYDE
ncbi:hypothetical protein [Flavobacterium caeni]|uniref:Lipoprotein n=1 Tax=Flavobacterium caeni TaxID=490189 RepID=A0A1G5KH68_9FLAO|nr:hypothetical protein [Flavobacterium caeni]SCY99744.1 hypothetical protein SAMN02927903_03298 [Flavobacterium caeni]